MKVDSKQLDLKGWLFRESNLSSSTSTEHKMHKIIKDKNSKLKNETNKPN